MTNFDDSLNEIDVIMLEKTNCFPSLQNLLSENFVYITDNQYFLKQLILYRVSIERIKQLQTDIIDKRRKIRKKSKYKYEDFLLESEYYAFLEKEGGSVGKILDEIEEINKKIATICSAYGTSDIGLKKGSSLVENYEAFYNSMTKNEKEVMNLLVAYFTESDELYSQIKECMDYAAEKYKYFWANGKKKEESQAFDRFRQSLNTILNTYSIKKNEDNKIFAHYKGRLNCNSSERGFFLSALEPAYQSPWDKPLSNAEKKKDVSRRIRNFTVLLYMKRVGLKLFYEYGTGIKTSDPDTRRLNNVISDEEILKAREAFNNNQARLIIE